MAVQLNHLVHAPDGPETAPPLLIAHGLFGSARNFGTLGRKLATARQVVTVDMRNHGASPWADDVSYAAMAEDLARTVRDICGGRAAVMGHSMGGKAAMVLALTHPEMVAGAVVADIAPVAYPGTHLPVVRAMRAADLTGITRRSQADGLLAPVSGDPGLRAFILQNLAFEDGRARWRLNLAALEAGMGALTGWSAPAAGRTYDGPALFVYGGASDYMGPAQGDAVRALFPTAEIAEIAGAGHWLHAERPTEFLAVVSRWLDGLAG